MNTEMIPLQPPNSPKKPRALLGKARFSIERIPLFPLKFLAICLASGVITWNALNVFMGLSLGSSYGNIMQTEKSKYWESKKGFRANAIAKADSLITEYEFRVDSDGDEVLQLATSWRLPSGKAVLASFVHLYDFNHDGRLDRASLWDILRGTDIKVHRTGLGTYFVEGIPEEQAEKWLEVHTPTYREFKVKYHIDSLLVAYQPGPPSKIEYVNP